MGWKEVWDVRYWIVGGSVRCSIERCDRNVDITGNETLLAEHSVSPRRFLVDGVLEVCYVGL